MNFSPAALKIFLRWAILQKKESPSDHKRKLPVIFEQIQA